MIVTLDTFAATLMHLSASGLYGLDTETTGLDYKDRLFSIILHDGKTGFYFNFIECPEARGRDVLPRSCLVDLAPIFLNPQSVFFIHNAKFDLKMLAKEGLFLRGEVHCTQVTARILENNHFKYTLDACAKRLGLAKDSAVEEYIKEHRLYESSAIPGKKQVKTRKFFDRVPLSIISKYAEKDAELAYHLGNHQFKKLQEMEEKSKFEPTLRLVYANEHRLLQVCMRMENTGIKIDRSYVIRALQQEQTLLVTACDEFLSLTGVEFTDSNKALEAVFSKIGAPMGRTEKGNPSFTQEVLAKIDSPIARLVTKIRHHGLYSNTYYSSFLHMADAQDVIHPEMRQDGTDTGRFSYSNPNLQNVPKEEGDQGLAYVVRKSFVPRLGFCFVSIDYDQQEFRMLLDYAGEEKLIAEVLAGKDVHQATADEIGIPRSQAKMINFAILYGAGAGKIAPALGIELAEAQFLKRKYFARLPRVQRIIRQISDVGKHRGYIWNWAGRRYRISDPEYAYILVNHLIQGGCSDVIKFAMVQIEEYLQPYQSRMIVQIHDELLLEIHQTELHLIEPIRRIMENVYPPKNGMKLTCSVSHSWKSWGAVDKIKGLPVYEGGNQIQNAALSAS